ncbi:MAG TPA: transglutaminase family protein [Chthonomonadaceae bacterium]|nr:transglutaminase family protein [Chthonomonadaceae bacterium]
MLLRIIHRTRSVYARPVTESHHQVRLMPLTDEDQSCLQFHLTTQPLARVRSFSTPSGNTHHFNIRSPHRQLEITAESLVETRRDNPFEGLNLVTDDWSFYAEDVFQDYAEFLAPTRLVPAHPESARIARVARRKAGASVASFAITLTRLLSHLLTYAPGATSTHTRLDEFLQNRRGVCQDFAHLMLAVCRSQRIPCRYVSGYVYSPPAEAPTHAEQATHAWVECLLPGGVWRGFDPTNDLLANARYVKAHWGRDYADAAPTCGVYRGAADQRLQVEVKVEAVPHPVHEPISLDLTH